MSVYGVLVVCIYTHTVLLHYVCVLGVIQRMYCTHISYIRQMSKETNCARTLKQPTQILARSYNAAWLHSQSGVGAVSMRIIIIKYHGRSRGLPYR